MNSYDEALWRGEDLQEMGIYSEPYQIAEDPQGSHPKRELESGRMGRGQEGWGTQRGCSGISAGG